MCRYSRINWEMHLSLCRLVALNFQMKCIKQEILNDNSLQNKNKKRGFKQALRKQKVSRLESRSLQTGKWEFIGLKL